MEAAPVRVLLVDDHPMVRDLVRVGCEEAGIAVVGEASTGVQALAACRELVPDVLVLDLILPGMDGFELLQRLREEGRLPKVLVLTNRDDQEAVFESIRLGVSGYLEKTASLPEVVEAIRTVAAGGQVFSPEHERMARARIADLARRARRAAAVAARLTARERQVLDLISQGLTTRQVASRLGLSERTVESHLTSLYDKLEVRSRLQAVHRAASLGLVDLRGP